MATTMLELADAWLKKWQPSPVNKICKCAGEYECVYCAGTKVMLALRQAAPGGGERIPQDASTIAQTAQIIIDKLLQENAGLRAALPQEAPAQPQAGQVRCLHEELWLWSGGFYLACGVCNKRWVAIKDDGNDAATDHEPRFEPLVQCEKVYRRTDRS